MEAGFRERVQDIREGINGGNGCKSPMRTVAQIIILGTDYTREDKANGSRTNRSWTIYFLGPSLQRELKYHYGSTTKISIHKSS